MKLEKKNFSQLKKQADKVFSLHIRTKYANWKGEVRCYTCDKVFTIKTIQCGHYVSRVYSNTRWLPENCRPQCYGCNVMKRGNMDEFAIRLEKETPGILEKLNIWKHQTSTVVKRLDLIYIINSYPLDNSL